TNIVTPPNLTIHKTASASTVVAGNSLTYTIGVGNTGGSTAKNVQIVDPLPAGVTLVSATPTAGTCGGTVTCSVGDVAPGVTVTVTIKVMTSATATGPIQNTASASGDNAP